MSAIMETVKPAVPVPVRERAKKVLRAYGVATSSSRPMPEFLVIGAKRGGTTSLFRYLEQHPQMASTFPSPQNIKHVHYFDKKFDMGNKWYRSHFPTKAYRKMLSSRAGAPAITGEATPYYLWHPLAAERAYGVLPEVKIIVLLRDPVERAYSHWKERRRENGEPIADFAHALDAEHERLAGEAAALMAQPGYVSPLHENHSYLSQSLYLEPLKLWMERFPREQFFIRTSEQFYADPQAMFDEITAFLGIQQHTLSDVKSWNATKPSSMDPKLRDQLKAHVAPHNRKLQEYLGMSLGWDA